jgi:glycopeptide antibiotics resistance protein
MKITQLLSEHKFFFLAIFWTILITTLSLITIERVPSFALKLQHKDKVVHFVFYFVFVIAWNLSLMQKLKKIKVKVLSIAIVYGIVIEVLQYVLTENRTADFFDVLANSLGAILAFVLFPFIVGIFSKAEIKN